MSDDPESLTGSVASERDLQAGDRVTLCDERAILLLRERAGKSGWRAPRISEMSALGRMNEHLWDAECEWWLERVVRKT